MKMKEPQIFINLIKYRKLFHTAQKESTETAKEWFSRVNKLSKSCIFGQNSKTFILDKFLTGLDEALLDILCIRKDKIIKYGNALELVEYCENLYKDDVKENIANFAEVVC